MTDDELDALALRCREAWRATPGIMSDALWASCLLPSLREAYDAGAKAARPLPPGDAPVLEGRLDEIREMVTHACSAIAGERPPWLCIQADLLAALDFERRRADHCESAMADLLAESDRYALGYGEGVAAALQALHRYVGTLSAGRDDSIAAYHLGRVAAELMEHAPTAPPLPPLASLARMRRLEAALGAIAAMPTQPTSETAFAKLARMVALARAAVKEAS